MRIEKTLKKFKIEGRTTYDLNTYSFTFLILSPQRLFNVARAVSSTGSTSVIHFFPKNNKARVKLGIAFVHYFEAYLETPQHLRWSSLWHY